LAPLAIWQEANHVTGRDERKHSVGFAQEHRYRRIGVPVYGYVEVAI